MKAITKKQFDVMDYWQDKGYLVRYDMPDLQGILFVMVERPAGNLNLSLNPLGVVFLCATSV